jgi:hypothetical protein
MKRRDHKSDIKLQIVRLKAAVARKELEVRELEVKATAELERLEAIEEQRQKMHYAMMAVNAKGKDPRTIEIPRYQDLSK